MSSKTDNGYELLKLEDTDLTLENPAHDIRGREVYSNTGEKIGEVEDLYVDDQETKVRFLDVSAGGFLGIGEKHFLVPVGVVSDVEEGRITVDHSRQKILDSPPLDTNAVPGPKQQYEVNTHYRDLPFSPFGA